LPLKVHVLYLHVGAVAIMVPAIGDRDPAAVAVVLCAFAVNLA
jgi:hypothetical protein